MTISGVVPPAGRWIINAPGFQWQYTFEKKDAAGGILAFNSTTELLGSYSAKITMLREEQPFCDVHVEVLNVSTWFSASRIPGRFQKLRALGINVPLNLFNSHPRGKGPYKPSRGGDYTQIYSFDLLNQQCWCTQCRLPL